MSMTSVAVLIISEKILGNIEKDELTNYILNEINNLEFKINKLTIIPGGFIEIGCEIVELKKYNDILLIIDDLSNGSTYKALEKVFSQDLIRNKKLEEILKQQKNKFTTNETLIPKHGKLITNNISYPVIHIQQVFVLNQNFLKESFKILKDHIVQYKSEIKFSKTIRIKLNGNSNKILNEIKKYTSNNNGIIKCKCNKENQFFCWNISSNNFDKITELEQDIYEKFNHYEMSSIDETNIWKLIWETKETHLQKAIQDIEICLDKYGPENVFVSFNGGKDCTVLMHLVLVVIKNKYSDYTKPLSCLYVQSTDPFPEQDRFILQCQIYYNLDIITLQCSIKQALQESLIKNPNYKACFMGSRRTDPYCSNLNVFQMTDENWPRIMRVSPLLDWNYSDIWDYLLYYKVPYCKLYDMGFTSLGNVTNTARNPLLKYFNNKEEKEMYLPAYKLMKDTKERSGREIN